MNRRQYLAALGAAAAGGTAITGTGAFTSVSATRTVDVSVADDANAFLAMAPYSGPNAKYATVTADGTLALDLTGSNGAVLGDGVNANGLTVVDNVFEIENRGTRTIELSGTKRGGAPDRVIFGVNSGTTGFTGNDVFHTFDPDAPLGISSSQLHDGSQPVGNQSRRVGVGDSVVVSLLIDARGVSGGTSLLDGVTVEAAAV